MSQVLVVLTEVILSELYGVRVSLLGLTVYLVDRSCLRMRMYPPSSKVNGPKLCWGGMFTSLVVQSTN